MLYNKAEYIYVFWFFSGSVISAGFHITADSCENTETIEIVLYKKQDQSGHFY